MQTEFYYLFYVLVYTTINEKVWNDGFFFYLNEREISENQVVGK